jgi:ABC-type glycerol-3-phosphate transport system substrate-binding protein
MLMVLTCALVASCAQAPSGARGQVLVVWHTLSGIKEQALLNLIDDWNRTNPYSITVMPERRDTNSIDSSVQQGINQKALPSLMLVSTSQAANYYQKGILTPLDTYIDDATNGWNATDRADLYPFILKAGITPNGQIVGVPYGGAVRVMFFNRDWLKTINLDNAPSTWDQFTSACATATDRAKGTLCFGIDPNATAFEQWLFAHGGQVTTDNMSVLQVSTPAALEAMNQLAGFVRANQTYRVTTRQQSRDDFASSRVLFTFDWSDQLNDVGAAVKQHGEFEWSVGLLPATEGRSRTTKLLAPMWVITRTPGTQNPDREMAAWLFIRWLMDGAQTARWATETGELPARLSTMNTLSDKVTPDSAYATTLRDIAPLARPEPLVSGWNCVENVLSVAIQQVFDGQPVTDTLQLAQATGQAQLNVDCSAQ